MLVFPSFAYSSTNNFLSIWIVILLTVCLHDHTNSQYIFAWTMKSTLRLVCFPSSLGSNFDLHNFILLEQSALTLKCVCCFNLQHPTIQIWPQSRQLRGERLPHHIPRFNNNLTTLFLTLKTPPTLRLRPTEATLHHNRIMIGTKIWDVRN